MYGLSTAACVGLSLAAAFLWGTPLVLKQRLIPSIDTVQLTSIFAIAQFLASTIFWLSMGTPLATSEFSAQLVLIIFYLLMCGASIRFGDYLYFAVSRKISVATTTSAAMVVQIIAGPLIDYVISSTDTNLDFLVLGVCLSVGGLLSLVYADVLQSQYIEPKTQEGSVEEAASLLPPSATKVNEESINIYFWIGFSMLVGFIFVGYTIFSTLAESSTDAVTDPALVSFVFGCGVLISHLMCVYLFSHLELFGHIDTHITSFDHLIDHVFFKQDTYQLVVAFMIGIYFASGFICYFIAVTVVPYSVSIAMGMMNVMFAVWGSIIVLGEYSKVPFFSWPIFFVAFGTTLYFIAIYVLLEYAYV